MLCLSLLAGGILAGGGRVWISLLAATAGILGFLAQHALREWFAGRAPFGVPLAFAGSAGTVLLLAAHASEHPVWIVPPLVAGTAAWALRWHRSRSGRTRMDDLPSHLAGAVALSSLCWLVALPGSTESVLSCLRLWSALSAQFCIGIAVVHARLVGRSSPAIAAILLAPPIAFSFSVAGGDLRWLALSFVFAAAAALRMLALARRWPLARAGWSEALTGLAVCLIGALR